MKQLSVFQNVTERLERKRLEKKKNSTKCKSVTGSFNLKSFEGRKKHVKLLFINDLIICSCSKVISL